MNGGYKKTTIFLVTGRPGSGKTTLGRRLCEFKRSQGHSAVLLDGDELREVLEYKDFTEAGRKRWMLRVAGLAKILEYNDVIPVIALVSPYRETRKKIAKMFKSFKLIYIKSDSERMWEGSVYEEPQDDERPIKLFRKGKKITQVEQ